jgi:hypothetical protein
LAKAQKSQVKAMAEFRAKAEGDRIALALSDDSGATTTIHVDAHQAFAILALIRKEIAALPGDPEAELWGQKPVLTADQPSFQIGITDAGNTALVIRPDPLPPMEFYFDDARLEKLISDLRSAAAMPKSLKKLSTKQ